MILPFVLYQNKVSWILSHWSDFEEWLEGKPWKHGANQKFITYPYHLFGTTIFEQRIKTLVYYKFFRYSEFIPKDADLWVFLSYAFGTPNNVLAYDLCKKVEQETRNTGLLIFETPPNCNQSKWKQQIELLSQTIEKIREVSKENYSFLVSSMIILYQHPKEVVDIRLDIVESPSTSFDVQNQKLWAWFVQESCLWYSGGELAILFDLIAPLNQLKMGDENHLQDILNQDSKERWQKLLHVQPQMDLNINNLHANFHRIPSLQHPKSLFFGCFDTIIPWVARNLLLQDNIEPKVEIFLRKSLICRPLQMHVFFLCQRIESLLQQLCMHLAQTECLDRTNQKNKQRLSTDPQYIAAFLERPNENSELLTLDYLIQSIRNNSPILSRLRDFQNIRNILAHNFAPSWSIVKRVYTLERHLMEGLIKEFNQQHYKY